MAGVVRRPLMIRPDAGTRCHAGTWVITLVTLVCVFAWSALPVVRPLHAAASPTAGCANVQPSPVAAGTTPILFVHGINSDPATWTKGTVSGTSQAPLNYVESALGTSQVTGYTFDWSKYSGFHAGSKLSWVTGPPASGPGPLLAQAIECVAGEAGHKVIIIAHSMGGLVTKYASTIDSVSSDIAAVFTLGTPFKGSWLDSTATGALGWLSQAIGAYCSFGGSLYPLGTGVHGAKQHVKPSGAIEALCHIVSERDDPGMKGMRTDINKEGWHTLSWSGGFPVFPLAASIQATSWQPLPLFGPQLTFAGFGDFVVGTRSELGGGTTPTVTCTVPIAGALVLPTLLDAVTASSCFHTNEPDNKTLLDSIISTIMQHHLIAPPKQRPPAQSPAPFAVTSSSPASGPAGGGTLIVIHGSGFSSVNKVVMNSVRPLPEGDPNYYKQNLHPSFSVVSDSEIDVTTPAGAAGLTYEIDFFTPTDAYFSTNFPGIPLFTFE
jgi:pimeloyl-ACP methyl ester carboxylesterase